MCELLLNKGADVNKADDVRIGHILILYLKMMRSVMINTIIVQSSVD